MSLESRKFDTWSRELMSIWVWICCNGFVETHRFKRGRRTSFDIGLVRGVMAGNEERRKGNLIYTIILPILGEVMRLRYKLIRSRHNINFSGITRLCESLTFSFEFQMYDLCRPPL